MEILRSGKNIYKHLCSKCDCLFAYSKTDVEHKADHPNSYLNVVCCPECGSEQIVNFEKRYKEKIG